MKIDFWPFAFFLIWVWRDGGNAECAMCIIDSTMCIIDDSTETPCDICARKLCDDWGCR